jgi:cytosol alanyl aminopeptidase
MRLGDAVRPLAYDLQVQLDPRRVDYSGTISIEVALARPLDFFWLHGTGLQVEDAQLTTGGRNFAARAVAGGEDFIGLQFAQVLPAGPARVTIRYRGSAATRDSRGIFQQHDPSGNAYLFTQFEPLHARRAFPCFDEPQWKTPWTLTLTVPAADLAVANTPVVSERALPDGMKQVRFATTKPLPTYLVAFAAGPFEVVDAGSAGQAHTPMRIITPKGRAADAQYARRISGRLLELLEGYFGMPYPFEKLDALAIPRTVGFSAMENPGLITYASFVLLARAQEEDERFQHRYAAVAAHEMAHQWFGDLVTMQWWDDVWLNESFATWMSRRIVQEFEPAWDTSHDRARERAWAFSADRLGSARQVRQPVRTREDMEGAFDGITYAKGAAVLSMYEQWLGPDAFRAGVRRYLQRHRFGNAQAPDFIRALAEADADVAASFSGFVLQPGLPLVDVELDCSGASPALVLRQQRFVPASPDAAPQRWRIPFCARVEGVAQPQCMLLAADSERMALTAAPHCPAWVLPNPGGAGYFLSRQAAARTPPTTALSDQEAAALVGDQALLAKSGGLPVARLLQVIEPMASDPRPPVVAAAAAAVQELPLQLFTPAQRQQLAAWTRKVFGARAAQLGWIAAPADSDAVRQLRRVVVPLVAELGEDPQLLRDARALALAWLQDDRRPLGALRGDILRAAARFADPALFDAFVAAARKPQEPSQRYEILAALGAVRDPVLLQRALEFALAPDVDVAETHVVYEHAADDADNARAAFAFVRSHYDALVGRVPDEVVVSVPRWHAALCSVEDRDALRAFFSDPARSRRPGAHRALEQTAEVVDLCARAATSQRAAGPLLPVAAGG